jgi:hypothetical protein
LNIGRALHEPGFGVLTRPNADDSSKTDEQLISLSQDTYITIRTPEIVMDTIKVRALRRVHRQQDGRYRILHLHNNRLEVLSNVTFPTTNADRFLALSKEGGMFVVELSRWADFVAPAR